MSTPIEDLDDLDENEEKTNIIDMDMVDDVLQEATSPIAVDEEVVDESEIGERKNPTIPFPYIEKNKELDIDSLVVGGLIIFIWILIWWTTGLLKTVFVDVWFTIIFFVFILYVVVNTYTSGSSSGGVIYELNILLSVEQMISILFGTIVLFTLFLDKISAKDDNCKSVVQLISMCIVVILTTASLWVSIWTSGRAFRSIRKFKQGIYNISLSLFILIGLIFIRTRTPRINSCIKQIKIHKSSLEK